MGRYKYNKKLGLSNRLAEAVAAEDVIDPNTGEILVEADQKISRELARQIEDAGVEFVMAYGKDDESRVTKVIGNKFVALNQYVEFDTTNLKVADKVFYPVLMEILEQCQDEDEIKEMLVARKHDLSPKHILMEDIIASVSYILNLNYGVGKPTTLTIWETED